MEQKPWIEGSLEILELAIEQYYMSISSDTRRDSNRYLRVALINTDDAVELAMKAFTQYQTGQFASRKFHSTLTWIKKNGPSLGISLPKGFEGKIRYYHNTRGTLYHQGYSLRISRLEVLDYIAKAIILFRLLFKEDLERSFESNPRRLFLLSCPELEKQVIDLASMNRIVVNEEIDIEDIIQSLIKKEVVEEDIYETFNEMTTILDRITPQRESLSKIGDIYEPARIISESILKLRDSVKRSSKRRK